MPRRAAKLALFLLLALATNFAIVLAAAYTPRDNATLRLGQFPVVAPGISDTLDLRELATWNSTLRGWHLREQITPTSSWLPQEATAAGVRAQSEEDLGLDLRRTTVLLDRRNGGFGQLPRGTAPSPTWGAAGRAYLASTQTPRAGVEYAAGWPFLALACELSPSIESPFLYDHYRKVASRGFILLRKDDRTAGTPPCRARILPLRPLYPGLAANTLLFALAWFLALRLTMIPTRRFLASRRAARGHCPACRYNLAGLPPNSPCPECGHTTSKADASPTADVLRQRIRSASGTGDAALASWQLFERDDVTWRDLIEGLDRPGVSSPAALLLHQLLRIPRRRPEDVIFDKRRWLDTLAERAIDLDQPARPGRSTRRK